MQDCQFYRESYFKIPDKNNTWAQFHWAYETCKVFLWGEGSQRIPLFDFTFWVPREIAKQDPVATSVLNLLRLPLIEPA